MQQGVGILPPRHRYGDTVAVFNQIEIANGSADLLLDFSIQCVVHQQS